MFRIGPLIRLLGPLIPTSPLLLLLLPLSLDLLGLACVLSVVAVKTEEVGEKEDFVVFVLSGTRVVAFIDFAGFDVVTG